MGNNLNTIINEIKIEINKNPKVSGGASTRWGATHPFAGFSPFNQPLKNALISDRENLI